MVGVDVSTPQAATTAAIRNHDVGNIFLAGRSSAGASAIAELTRRYTELPTAHDAPMMVATDQEGGLVQVLKGPGFSTIPSAMAQSASSPASLRSRATTWGRELASAGVTLNLAPVVDVVPDATTARRNAPIGAFDRSYGYGLASAERGANAFAAGMRAAGVDAAIKHFPGLGLVRGNTDVSAGVTDTQTTRSSDSVRAFRSAIASGAGFVMTSSAVYERIDARQPAVFSPTVVDGLLRRDLGFRGVVITDDLSAAQQVAAWTPGRRAVRAIGAGNDIVLASARPEVAGQMADAIAEQARRDPAFARQVDAAAQRVLAAKERLRR